VIVFWRHHKRQDYGHYVWRCYKGRAKLRNLALHIYPCNGRRSVLTDFIAFDDQRSQPPQLVTPFGGLTGNVEALTKATLFSGGTAREHLPPTYIDGHGNIRRTDEKLTLVLMGPEWNELKEDEFQQAIDLPF